MVSSVVGFFVLILAAFFYYQFAVVSGSEFNTSTWTLREFQYRQDLITHYQIAGRRYSSSSSLINTAGAATAGAVGTPAPAPPTTSFPIGYISRNNTTPRWDLVEIRASSGTYPGPAKVLTTYFQTPQAQEFWETWSKNNPAKAADLWQAAKDLIDLGLYYALPTLMEAAPIDCSKEDFTRKVKAHMVATVRDAYQQIKSAADSPRLELADELLKIYSN